MMGLENTLEVSLDNMIHHSRSVASVLIGKHLCVDMPFGTYQVSATQAAENAIRLVQLGRAHSVKIEGGVEVAPQIAAISNAGIPVVAHLGLTPQSVHKLGGHRVQGRDDDGRKKLHEDALAVQEAGAQLLVLELVPAQLASELTDILNIPTVGIGAGVDCDGQVLVLQDLLGFDSGFTPKFLKRYLDMETLVTEALNEYDSEVKESVFPNKEQSY
jgi:3-methyl-2-oxobutanoate hydroxymethyltransferase